jgi:ParB-like chromosome segregation protein Spo0J
MTAPLLWPVALADVAGFPAELLGPLAGNRILTVGDVVALVKLHNPGLIPPATALGVNVWRRLAGNFSEHSRSLSIRAGAVLAELLGYPDNQCPRDWTDPPSGRKPQPKPQPKATMTPRPEAEPKPEPVPAPELVSPHDLELHPDASEVDEMPADQYAEFLADIKTRGVQDPLERIRGTKVVIDGRTRRKAAIEAGLSKVPVVDVDLAGMTPAVYMLRKALFRRHFSKQQRLDHALKIGEKLEAEARERKREGGTKGRETAARNRENPGAAPLVGDLPQAETQSEPAATRSRDRAAALAGVSPRTYSDGKLVKDKAPELYEQVKAGKVSVSAAAKQVREQEKPKPTEPSKPALSVKVAGGSVALLPCPFCGSKEIIMAFTLSKRVAECQKCKACGPPRASVDVDGTRSAWNNRAAAIAAKPTKVKAAAKPAKAPRAVRPTSPAKQKKGRGR